MGQKGDRLTENSAKSAEILNEKLNAIEGIQFKKMFGGHGIFHEGKMFGIVNSKGDCYFKADESTKSEYDAKGSHKHSKMPYYLIPNDVLNENELLLEWTKKSIAISK